MRTLAVNSDQDTDKETREKHANSLKGHSRSSKNAKAKAKPSILANKDSTTEALDTSDHDVAEANHVAEYEDPAQEEGQAPFSREASPQEASPKPAAKKPLS